MSLTINTEPDSVDNNSSWELESTNYCRPNFRVKAELIVSGVKKATKFQSNLFPSLFYSTNELAHPEFSIGTNRISPTLWYYNDKTYGVYMKREGTPYNVNSMIFAFDHLTETFSDSYLCLEGLANGQDDHAGSCVIVADDGHIIVAREKLQSTDPSTGHNSSIYIMRSDNAEDETSWVNALAHDADYFSQIGGDAGNRLAYPHMAKITGGDLFLWARDITHCIRIFKSTDDGVSWDGFGTGEANGLVVYDCPVDHLAYNGQISHGVDANLHMVIFPYDDTNNNFKAIYYLWSTDGITWRNVDNSWNKDVSVAAITDAEAQANLIVCGGAAPLSFVYRSGIIDSSDRIHILITSYQNFDLTHYWWDGAAWQSDTAEITDYYYGGTSAVLKHITSTTTHDILAGKQSGTDEFYSFSRTTNNADWTMLREIDPSDDLRYAQMTFNYPDADYLLYAFLNCTDSDYSDLIFYYEKPIDLDFKKILWSLITYDTIDFDSLNTQTPNNNSYKSYTIKFTEYWEDSSNALVEGDNTLSDTKYIFEVDVSPADFDDYNLSADDELFLTAMPAAKKKIRINDNIVTGWTNRAGASGFDTFTTSGRYITSAIDSSAVNIGSCYSNAIGAIKEDEIILIYCDITLNSGTLPNVGLIEGTTISWKSNYESLSSGYNYIELTATDDISNARIYIETYPAANQVNFAMSLVYISKAYNEIDYLALITEETSLWINYEQFDIDGSSLGSTHLDTVTILGYRGICPVTALLFTHSTTQVESIIVKMRTTTPADRSVDMEFIRDPVCYKFPVRIEWLNKFGAFDAYTFLADYDENRKTSRQYYKDTDDTEQILDIESYQEIEAFSIYETKTMLDWLKTIQDSKKVYWVVDNERIEVTVISSDQQIKKAMSRNRISLRFRKII